MIVTRVGDYELISKLGEGGMGAVFKARQISLDRIVAVKILPAKLARDASFIERFQREARATAKLNHPHIISGIGVGEERGFHYFAMEYVDGATLKSRINREGQMQEEEVLRIGVAIASALAHAHSVGLIHRDVKPDNILIAADGTPKLADLGLAKGSQVEDASLTQSGCAVGTPHYIAPEQAAGEELDGRADAYSLGCTLYHALTGRVPFEGTAVVLLVKHLNEKLPHPQVLRPDLSNGMCAILAHLVARDRHDRYANLDEAVDDMNALLAGESPVTKPLPTSKLNFLTTAAGAGSARSLKPAERTSTRRHAPILTSGDRIPKAAPPKKQWLPYAVSAASILLVGGFLISGRSRDDAVPPPAPKVAAVPSVPALPIQAPLPPALPQRPAVPPPLAAGSRVPERPNAPSEPVRTTAPAVRPENVERAPLMASAPAKPQELPVVPAAFDATQIAADAVQLFNGRDMSRFKVEYPEWSVVDGMLVGRGINGHNSSISVYSGLPRAFELTVACVSKGGFHIGWSTSQAFSHNVMVENGELRLTEYQGTSRDLMAGSKRVSSDMHTYRITVVGKTTTVEVDGEMLINYNQTPLPDERSRDLYIFAWGNSVLNIKTVAFRDASNLAPPKPAVDPAVAARAKQELAEAEARRAMLALHEGLLSAARTLDAKACSVILASAEKDEKLKSFAAELKEDQVVCAWLDDLLVAEIVGAKKLGDIDDFELRLTRGEPMHVGKRAPFKLIKAEKGIIEIGSGGMSFQKPVSQLAPETRCKLAEMGLGNDTAGQVRRAFVALLLAPPGDKKALAAAGAAVEKAKKADSGGSQSELLERWLKVLASH